MQRQITVDRIHWLHLQIVGDFFIVAPPVANDVSETHWLFSLGNIWNYLYIRHYIGGNEVLIDQPISDQPASVCLQAQGHQLNQPCIPPGWLLVLT